ncbi:unnamed protein product [Choristocarpus tenellus]
MFILPSAWLGDATKVPKGYYDPQTWLLTLFPEHNTWARIGLPEALYVPTWTLRQVQEVIALPAVGCSVLFTFLALLLLIGHIPIMFSWYLNRPHRAFPSFLESQVLKYVGLPYANLFAGPLGLAHLYIMGRLFFDHKRNNNILAYLCVCSIWALALWSLVDPVNREDEYSAKYFIFVETRLWCWIGATCGWYFILGFTRAMNKNPFTQLVETGPRRVDPSFASFSF